MKCLLLITMPRYLDSQTLVCRTNVAVPFYTQGLLKRCA